MKKITLVTLVFFVAISVFSQTRCYITAVGVNGTGPVVARHPDWTNQHPTVSEAVYMRTLTPFPSSASGTSGNNTLTLYNNLDTPQVLLIRRCLTPKLAKQTLNGTFTGSVRFRGTGTNRYYGILRLVNRDGTVAQELGKDTNFTNSTGASWYTKIFNTFPPFNNLQITAGQRILIEIGTIYSSGAGSNTGINRGYDPTYPDSPFQNNQTGNSNGWFEFSQTIKWMPNVGGLTL
jgi:hypothetical protein